jgi:hypothetical protein
MPHVKGGTSTTITEMRILLITAKYRPNVLFCMPNRTKCIQLGDECDVYRFPPPLPSTHMHARTQAPCNMDRTHYAITGATFWDAVSVRHRRLLAGLDPVHVSSLNPKNKKPVNPNPRQKCP